MVDRFNALVARNNVEFQAWFTDRTHSERSWNLEESTWYFDYRYLPVSRIGKLKLHWPLPALGRQPDLIISGYDTPVWIVGWVIARCRGVKTGFRVLKTFDTWVNRNRFKDAVKRFMFSRADAIETVGDDGREFAIKYGASPQRVFFATHTVDIERARAASGLRGQGREALRAHFGLNGFTFIYVGRLVADKGLDYLVEAFALVQKRCSQETSLLLVGDGAAEIALRESCRAAGIRNVVFTGFVQKHDLLQYYALADAFVFPTLGDPYGIVVDEAMACSLPVISTSSAGEVRVRIEDGVNGYIVAPADSNALAEKMLCLLANPRLHQEMGKRSYQRIQGHTPERWAEDFERLVDGVLGKNASRVRV